MLFRSQRTHGGVNKDTLQIVSKQQIWRVSAHKWIKSFFKIYYKFLIYVANERDELGIVGFPLASSICGALNFARYKPQSQ